MYCTKNKEFYIKKYEKLSFQVPNELCFRHGHTERDARRKGICNQLRSSAGGGRTGLVRGRVLPSFSSSYHIFFHITGPVFIYNEATVFQIKKKKIISISFY